jgi:hypothetical protein
MHAVVWKRVTWHTAAQAGCVQAHVVPCILLLQGRCSFLVEAATHRCEAGG